MNSTIELFHIHGVQLLTYFDNSHPVTGGNKAWKLKAALKNSSPAGIATFGGAYSHHLLATAWYAAENQIPSIGYVRGEEVAILPRNPILKSCERAGMKLQFLNRSTYRRFAPSGIAPSPLKAGTVVLPEGGASHEHPGEFPFQIPNNIHVLVPTGTGTTAKFAKHWWPTHRVVAALAVKDVSVEQSLTRAGIECITVTRNGFGPVVLEEAIQLLHWCEEHRVLPDPLYGGKLLLHLHNQATKGNFTPGKWLWLPTGGAIGWFGLMDKYPPLKDTLKQLPYAESRLDHLLALLESPPGPIPTRGIH